VRSAASTRFTDVKVDVPTSRGQYLDGSRAATGGLFVDGTLTLARPRLVGRAGLRVGWSVVHAPGDPESGTRAVDRSWIPVAAHGGLEWHPHRAFALLVDVDHSYRAPNLDDLTSRQQTGPGFQFENPDLRPERATTFELGARVRTSLLQADLWLFETLLEDAIVKSPRDATACPPATPQCQSSYSKIQLVNAPALSELRGVEAAVRLRFPSGLTARATLAYAWGEGPRVGVLPSSTAGYDRPEVRGDRVPLSRVPPLNGTVELTYLHARTGFSIVGALRWATEQDRLALADYADARIPRFGTPGFAVVDLRASWRPSRRLFVAAVVENVFDVAYRYHGSSVNDAGRGLILQLEAALN
jgi:outer membrane receptor protein involved in Fe transport